MVGEDGRGQNAVVVVDSPHSDCSLSPVQGRGAKLKSCGISTPSKEKATQVRQPAAFLPYLGHFFSLKDESLLSLSSRWDKILSFIGSFPL